MWPLEIAVFLWPVGMVQVINGTIDDGYNGILGWIWIACAVTTIGLVAMTWVALKERYYSAVMARRDCCTSRSSPRSAPTSSPAPS
jgi:hypothetical protein